MGARWETIGAWNLGVKITGILVDPYGHLNMHGYHNFGIVDEPVHHLLRTAEERVPTRAPTEKLPKDENRHFPLYRLTTGSLHDVTGMEVRRHGNRCLGLRILHPNGQDDCLGSWDPLDTSSITTIYESHQGPLTALRFHMAEGECHFVSGITPCVKIADRGQRIPASSLEEEDPHESLTPPAEPSDFKQYKCGQPGKVRSVCASSARSIPSLTNHLKMLGWWCDEKRDEIRSFEPVAPERVPNTDVRMQMSMRWQPPPAGSNYRQWGDE